MLVRHKDKLYDLVTAGPWEAAKELDPPKVSDIGHHWNGAMIPLAKWDTVSSFLKWSYDETKGETVVHGFYSETEENWEFGVLPQKPSGMTINMLNAAEDLRDALRLLGGDYELAMTVHHHCSAGAFQSGTDKKDELDTVGLHLTLGDMDKDVHSIHSRCSFGKTITKAFLADWFELGPAFNGLKAETRELALIDLLCNKGSGEFPAVWKESIIKEAPRTQLVCGYTWQGSNNHLPTHNRYHNHYPYLKDFAENLKDIITEHGYGVQQVQQLADWCADASRCQACEDVAELLGNYYNRTLGDAAEKLRVIAQEMGAPKAANGVVLDSGDPELDLLMAQFEEQWPNG